jgi:putative ABC transport system permease protein
MPRLALRAALGLVRVIAVLVPAATRAQWTAEWSAELEHRARLQERCQAVNRDRLGDNERFTIHCLTPRVFARRSDSAWSRDMDLIRRALGALPDAAWLRRQFTLDADAVRDAAHGVRMLGQAPGFTLSVLLVFALGIGATTAILSLTDALLMRPLSLPGADRVMTMWQVNRETGQRRLDVAPANAIDWMQRTRSFEALAIAENWSVKHTMPGGEPQQPLAAARVTESFFKVLAVRMVYGRGFGPDDYRPGSNRTIVLSHRVWSDRFGADPSVIGRVVIFDENVPYTIIGVMPAGIELRLVERSRRPEPLVWLPRPPFDDAERNNRTQGYWNLIGRLAPGVALQQAEAELELLSANLAREHPKTNADVGAEIVPIRAHLAGSLRALLPLFLGAAAILLFVACANVATLFLARGAGRIREFAMRQALGASRGRLVRQMLTESLLLATLGGALGLLLARWTLDTVARLRPPDIALIDRVPIDARSALIACGVTLLAALVSGLVPSVQLSRPAAAQALRAGRSSAGRRTHSTLVVLEVAAAFVLAIGAGLLTRSFVSLVRTDPGFQADHVSVLQVFAYARQNTPDKRTHFFAELVDRTRALPGVVAAGVVSSMPFGEAKILSDKLPFTIVGRAQGTEPAPLVNIVPVAGDYFGAMSIPLLRGRAFDRTDSAQSAPVVLVSHGTAKQFWPDADPVGATVRFQLIGRRYEARVVGVVGDVRHESLDRPARAELFLPHAQSGFGSMSLVVRTAPGSPVTIRMLKDQVWALDPALSIYSSGTLDQLVSKTLTGRRFNLFLLSGFAAATLLLATVGVFALVSFSTTQRLREFAVRMALGARSADIVRLVLVQAVALAMIGVAIGVAIALPLTPMLRRLLFGVPANDPATFVAVASALVAIAAAACYQPARRAVSVDPSLALRRDAS